MAGRFTRFLKLERPHQRGGQQTPVTSPGRFAPEEPRAPGSGIETDEEPADAQPFLRCARCEMDNTRFADRCVNCGAPLHTPEQDVYNRQLWQKRRAEAAAEREALEKMHAPPATVEVERLRPNDPRYALGEVLAREVAEREASRLLWMADSTMVPVGVRAVMAMPSRWRWRIGIALTAWLAGTGIAALVTHRPTPMWLFFGTLAVLLALFTPSRPRRYRYWWSSGWW